MHSREVTTALERVAQESIEQGTARTVAGQLTALAPQEFEALRRAARESLAEIRRDRLRLEVERQAFGVLLGWVQAHLFEPTLNVASAVAGSGVAAKVPAALAKHLGEFLKAYIERHRLATARRMLDEGMVYTARVGTAVGLPAYDTFCEAYNRQFGEPPPKIRNSQSFPPAFDFVTWYRAQRGDLTRHDVRILLRQLEAGALRRRPILEPSTAALGALRREVPVVLRRHSAVWERACQDADLRIASDADLLPSQLRRPLVEYGRRLFEPGLEIRELQEELDIGDSGLTGRFVPFMGESLRAYFEKRRLETVLRVLYESPSVGVSTAAEAAGMPSRRLRRGFWRCLGIKPSKVRQLGKNGDEIDYEVWRRAGQGALRGGEARRLAEVLWRKLSEESCAEEFAGLDFGEEPSAGGSERVVISTSESALKRWLESDDWLAAIQPAKKTPLGPGEWSDEHLRAPEDWDELENVAQMLARKKAVPEVRRGMEQLFFMTPGSRTLYRVREIQSAVTATVALESGELPEEELWMTWLWSRLAPQEELQRVGREAVWVEVDRQLVDAPEAIARWRDTAEKRRRLFSLPVEEQERVAQEDTKYCDYLLARQLLDHEHYHHRSTPLGLWETGIATQIAQGLKTTYPCHGIVLDLGVLAWARRSNAQNLLATLPEATASLIFALSLTQSRSKLGIYVQGELARYHAQVLLARGDLELAEDQIDRAINVFLEPDAHRAGWCGLVKAEIQRRRNAKSFLQVLQRSANLIETWRDPNLRVAADNNQIYYLMEKGLFDEALRLRLDAARPRRALHKAARTALEGCIAIAQGDFSQARYLMEISTEKFLHLGNAQEVGVNLLYLAAIESATNNRQAATRLISRARDIASFYNLGPIGAIRRLVAQGNCNPSRIMGLARRMGGCLGDQDLANPAYPSGLITGPHEGEIS